MKYEYQKLKIIAIIFLSIFLFVNSEAAEKIISIGPGNSDSNFKPLRKGPRATFCDLPSYIKSYKDNQIVITDSNNKRILIFTLNGDFIRKVNLPKSADNRIPSSVIGSDNSGNIITYHNCINKNYSKVGIWDIDQGTYKDIDLDWKKANKKFSDFTHPSYKDGYIKFDNNQNNNGYVLFDQNGNYIGDTEYIAWSEKGVGVKYMQKSLSFIPTFFFTDNNKIMGEVIKEVEFNISGIVEGYAHYLLGFDSSGKCYFYREDWNNDYLGLSIVRFDPFTEIYEINNEHIPFYNGIRPMFPIPSLMPSGLIILRIVQPTQSLALYRDDECIGSEFSLKKPDAIQVDFWKIKF